MISSLFNVLVRKKQRVVRLFQFLWLLQCVGLFFCIKSVLMDNVSSMSFWYEIAILSGKTALVFFAILLSPGIFKRFEVRNRILGLIMIFRRQLGISMFLFVAIHGLTVSLLPRIKNAALLEFSVFELFGLSAFILLFFLFLSSNDISQAKLGKWWYLLHRLVYIIMWLILIHVAIQRISLWTALASVLVVSEMAGIIYSNLKKRLALQ